MLVRSGNCAPVPCSAKLVSMHVLVLRTVPQCACLCAVLVVGLCVVYQGQLAYFLHLWLVLLHGVVIYM